MYDGLSIQPKYNISQKLFKIVNCGHPIYSDNRPIYDRYKIVIYTVLEIKIQEDFISYRLYKEFKNEHSQVETDFLQNKVEGTSFFDGIMTYDELKNVLIKEFVKADEGWYAKKEDKEKVKRGIPLSAFDTYDGLIQIIMFNLEPYRFSVFDKNITCYNNRKEQSYEVWFCEGKHKERLLESGKGNLSNAELIDIADNYEGDRWIEI